jgi:cytochrome b561
MISARAPGEAYSHGAIGFHWLTAALVLTLIPLGITISNMNPGPLQDRLYVLHESVGIVLWPIVAGRLVYRLKNPPPPMEQDIPALMKGAAHAVHWALYLGLLANPVLGWLGVSAFGASIDFFWLIELPHLVAKDEALAELLLGWHRRIGILIALAVCAHVGGALFHHYVRRDRTLLRMLGR